MENKTQTVAESIQKAMNYLWDKYDIEDLEMEAMMWEIATAQLNAMAKDTQEIIDKFRRNNK
jgi:hypothetical protein